MYSTDPEELALKGNDIVVVLYEDDSGCWEGEINGRSGRFPSNFVEEFVPPTGALSPRGTLWVMLID